MPIAKLVRARRLHMLVLTRQRDETIVIVIGKKIIEITVTDVRADKVRLGMKAHPRVKFYRKEV